MPQPIKTPIELAAERAEEMRVQMASVLNRYNRDLHEMYSDSDLESVPE